jgi:hypothetical protein
MWQLPEGDGGELLQLQDFEGKIIVEEPIRQNGQVNNGVVDSIDNFIVTGVNKREEQITNTHIIQ